MRVWRYGALALAGIHLAFALAWCAVVGLYLARWYVTGDHDGMIHGHYDPKDLVPFGDDEMNPFTWIYSILTLLYLFGHLFSPALLLTVTVPLLATGRRLAAQVAGRIAWRVLLVAAATALALPLTAFTPLGQDALTWWLD